MLKMKDVIAVIAIVLMLPGILFILLCDLLGLIDTEDSEV